MSVDLNLKQKKKNFIIVLSVMSLIISLRTIEKGKLWKSL